MEYVIVDPFVDVALHDEIVPSVLHVPVLDAAEGRTILVVDRRPRIVWRANWDVDTQLADAAQLFPSFTPPSSILVAFKACF
jgi:hypothetical protein